MTTIDIVQSPPAGTPTISGASVRRYSGTTGVPAAPTVQSPSVEGAGPPEAEGASEAETGEPRPPARDRRQQKKRYASPLDQSSSWLTDDPSRWTGRRVRNRKTGTIYLVRQVYKSGRVELERNWMTYLSDVKTIRTEYEPNG